MCDTVIATYNFCEIDGGHDHRLSDTQTSNESTSIDRTEIAVVTHENGSTDDPEQTELTSGPDTTDTVTHQESTVVRKQSVSKSKLELGLRSFSPPIFHLQESTTNGTNLDHGRNIGLDVGLLDLAVGTVVDIALEILGVEGAGNETLIDTTGSTHQAKGNDGEP